MRKTLGAAAAVWAVAGGLALLAIMAVTTTNVGAFALDRIARIFGASVSGLPGYEDFVQLAVGAAALTFFPWCQHKRGHVTVELFSDGLPPPARAALDRLWLAATVVAALFLARMMWIGMLETRADRALSGVLGWPVWPFYLPGVLSLILWALIAAVQMFGPAEEPRHG